MQSHSTHLAARHLQIFQQLPSTVHFASYSTRNRAKTMLVSLGGLKGTKPEIHPCVGFRGTFGRALTSPDRELGLNTLRVLRNVERSLKMHVSQTEPVKFRFGSAIWLATSMAMTSIPAAGYMSAPLMMGSSMQDISANRRKFRHLASRGFQSGTGLPKRSRLGFLGN